MKKRAFTLTEMLAVLTILTILVGLATLSVTKYRKNVDEKDLENLHRTIETMYNNFRIERSLNGEKEKEGDTITISKNPSNKEKMFIEKYFKDLTYNGKKLKTEELYGTVITLKTKEDVFKNRKTNGYDDYVESRRKQTKIKKNGNIINATIEDIYVIDATCEVKSEYTVKDNIANDYINKKCNTNNNGIIPSHEDLVCIKVVYKNQTVINDYSKASRAKSFNELCNFVSDNNG